MGILSTGQIVMNKERSVKDEVIQLIAEKAVELGLSEDQEELVKSFMERERLGATGMGSGIAIPHAKSASVSQVAVIIVKSEVPIEWESLDDQPVYFVIALMVPEENVDNVHLKVLSSLSRKLVNEEFKKSIFRAETPEQLMELFSGFSSEAL